MFRVARGIVKAFDPSTYRASVQIVGSGATYLASMPVARNIPPWRVMVGAACGVLFFDESNPKDGCVVGLYEGAPGASCWTSTNPVATTFNAQAYADFISTAANLEGKGDLLAELSFTYSGSTVRTYAGVLAWVLDGAQLIQYMRFGVFTANSHVPAFSHVIWTGLAAGPHTVKVQIYVQTAPDVITIGANSARLTARVL